jgi:hypothetical protein
VVVSPPSSVVQVPISFVGSKKGLGRQDNNYTDE